MVESGIAIARQNNSKKNNTISKLKVAVDISDIITNRYPNGRPPLSRAQIFPGPFPSVDRDVCWDQMSNQTWAPYQDKLAVKDVVRDWSGGRIHTATTLLVAREAKDVTLSEIQEMPGRYVVKSSHGTGGVLIVQTMIYPGIIFKEAVVRCLKEPCNGRGYRRDQRIPLSNLTRVLRNHCASLLQQTTVSTLEASYNSIPPGCLFEELFADSEADSMVSELQVWVVDRRPFFIRHDVEFETSRNAGGFSKLSPELRGNDADASTPLAYYFDADGHHIPGLHIRHDCEKTTAAAYAHHCSSPDHERPTLPLTPATRKLLVDFSALAAERTGANVLRVSAYRG